MIKPLVHQNMTDEVFRQILDLLKQKKWTEGDRLPSENELKDMFGVSRNTIRSALNRLSIIGVIETRRGEGTFVKKMGVGLYMNSLIPHIFHNDYDIYTITEFRKGIEVQSARLAAERASADELQDIEKALHNIRLNSGNTENFIQLDMEFHLSIAKASHNDLIYQALLIIRNYCYAALQNFITAENMQKSFAYHTQIIEALKNRRPEDAASFMNAHITDIYTQIDDDRLSKRSGRGG
jgi:GntR family transcriptional regulator, transcriptional repressor for pyruvate dehydrogenase complex